MAVFTVTVQAKVNQPPSQVGDGAASTDYGDSYTFTVADFTTNTSPIYVDPEGDAASQLKITLVPANGELQLNAVTVSNNDIINFSDIASGLFTYVPDNGNTSLYTDPFQFEIADSGSGTFVG
jgi:hypothetical protein